MSEWKEYKFTEVATLTNGRAYLQPELQSAGKYKIVRVGNLSGGDKWFYSDMELPVDKYCNKGDLLYAWACSFGPYIWEGNKTIYHYHIWKVDVNSDVSDKFFLYYYLKYYTPKWMGLTNGSVMMHITKGSLEKQIIHLPPLETQKNIASILSALDDKIAVNRRICENLEAQAQALFKHWFIDFAPFKNGKFVESELGMIPEGWRVRKLGSFFPIKTGKKDANIATATGQYPFFSCSQNVLTTDVFSFDGSAILVAGNGDFNVKWYEGKFEAYQRTYVLMPYESSYTHFLFYAIQYNLREITCGAGGTVIKFIRKADLENFKIAIPQELDKCDVLSVFSEINKNIANISTESNSLSTLRDTLLPKLMSGQIKV